MPRCEHGRGVGLSVTPAHSGGAGTNQGLGARLLLAHVLLPLCDALLGRLCAVPRVSAGMPARTAPPAAGGRTMGNVQLLPRAQRMQRGLALAVHHKGRGPVVHEKDDHIRTRLRAAGREVEGGASVRAGHVGVSRIARAAAEHCVQGSDAAAEGGDPEGKLARSGDSRAGGATRQQLGHHGRIVRAGRFHERGGPISIGSIQVRAEGEEVAEAVDCAGGGLGHKRVRQHVGWGHALLEREHLELVKPGVALCGRTGLEKSAPRAAVGGDGEAGPAGSELARHGSPGG